MYTAVLMMALTTGADMPDARRGGCGGGCFGGCMGGGRHARRGGGCCGCYGGGYGGCYGGGCCGCYGGGYGGCYGGGYGGCYGGGYGGCYGGGISYGGCMGSGIISGGCYGGGIISGGCAGTLGTLGGGIIMPSTGATGEQLKGKPKEKKEGETMAPAPATIVVDLPADAKLLIDNEATTSTGSSRIFTSPVLNPGKAYHYTLKAEIVRDGKTIKAEKVIAVKAGEVTSATLTLPAVGVAQR